MKGTKGLIWIILIISLISCQNKTKRFIDRLNECVYDDKIGMIEKDLYPFDINNSDKGLILAYCDKGVVFDSILDKRKENETNLIFSLTDKTSIIKYYQMFYKAGDKKNLKLFEYSITTNIIKFKNEIKIGMPRDDFFEKIKRDYVDCDTFEINLGLTGFYYFFVFRKDTLIRIERKMATM